MKLWQFRCMTAQLSGDTDILIEKPYPSLEGYMYVKVHMQPVTRHQTTDDDLDTTVQMIDPPLEMGGDMLTADRLIISPVGNNLAVEKQQEAIDGRRSPSLPYYDPDNERWSSM